MGRPNIIRWAESRVFMKNCKLAYIDKKGDRRVVSVFAKSMGAADKVVRGFSDFVKRVQMNTPISVQKG